MKQAVKKNAGLKSAKLGAEEIKKTISAFKKENNLAESVEKEERWLLLPEAFEKATKLPGIPLGYCTRVRGKSNTGKSTIKMEVIKACQNQGIVPVVFELENNFSWKHAKEVGVEISEEIDKETGEVVYGPGDYMLYYDTAALFDIYGKFDHKEGKYLSKPARETYVIEDVALCIRDLLKKQSNGELPFDMMFVIDSIGVGSCYRAATSNCDNNMWFAGALSQSFNTITNTLIPGSRNINSPYLNSLFFVQKTWTQMTAQGIPQAMSKGGETMDWAVRISLYLGGIASSSIKVLSAKSNGKEFNYGIKTKIKVEKNHVSELTYTGEICSLTHGLWDPDKLDEYKKIYADEIKKRLAESNKVSLSEIGDLEYSEREEED